MDLLTCFVYTGNAADSFGGKSCIHALEYVSGAIHQGCILVMFRSQATFPWGASNSCNTLPLLKSVAAQRKKYAAAAYHFLHVWSLSNAWACQFNSRHAHICSWTKTKDTGMCSWMLEIPVSAPALWNTPLSAFVQPLLFSQLGYPFSTAR